MIAGFIADRFSKDGFYIVSLVFLVAFIVAFLNTLNRCYVKVDQYHNKLKDTDKYNAKTVKNKLMIHKGKMYFLDCKFDQKKELYSAVSPIVIHSINRFKKTVTVSFIYDHPENQNHLNREVQIHNDDMCPVATVIIEK